MSIRLTLEVWFVDGWYVGRLRQIPELFSRGKSLEDLEENIREAYSLTGEVGPALSDEEIELELEFRQPDASRGQDGASPGPGETLDDRAGGVREPLIHLHELAAQGLRDHGSSRSEIPGLIISPDDLRRSDAESWQRLREPRTFGKSSGSPQTDFSKSDAGEFVDKSEDPEEMLEQRIRELDQSYRIAEVEVGQVIADEKKIRREYQRNLEQAVLWEEKARLAAQKGDDELARRALERKESHAEIAHELKSELDEQVKMSELLQDDLRTLETTVQEVKRKMNLLLARTREAKARKVIRDAVSDKSTLK
jgi:predicted RNase H-like HicB family nuclease